MRCYVALCCLLFGIALAQDTPAGQDCPNGWVVFQGSCYFVGFEEVKFDEAMAQCMARLATMWVPDSYTEWDALRLYAGKGKSMWFGLMSLDERNTTWYTDGGINAEELPWLVKTPGHGLGVAAQCASYFSAPVRTLSFVHWYPCSLPRMYLCERNTSAVDRFGTIPTTSA